jgi:hypothetical protein
MKPLYFLLFSFSGILLCPACQDKKQHKPDSVAENFLRVEYDTVFLEKEAGNCAFDEYNCLTISVQYPRIKGNDSISMLLNNKIESWLIHGTKDSFPGGAEALMQRYADEYQRWRKENEKYPAGWQVEKTIEVACNWNNLLCLRFEEFENTGGAHPVSRTSFKNYWLKEMRNLQLKDILTDGYENTLSKLAEFYLQESRKLDFSDKTGQTELDLEKLSKIIKNNFSLNETGITFVLNTYDIAAYSEGSSEFTIPYAEIIKSNLIDHRGPLGFLLSTEVLM